MFDDLNVAVADEDGGGVQGLQDVGARRLVSEGDVLETLTAQTEGYLRGIFIEAILTLEIRLLGYIQYFFRSFRASSISRFWVFSALMLSSLSLKDPACYFRHLGTLDQY